jgi:hypothetical protein
MKFIKLATMFANKAKKHYTKAIQGSTATCSRLLASRHVPMSSHVTMYNSIVDNKINKMKQIEQSSIHSNNKQFQENDDDFEKKIPFSPLGAKFHMNDLNYNYFNDNGMSSKYASTLASEPISSDRCKKVYKSLKSAVSRTNSANNISMKPRNTKLEEEDFNNSSCYKSVMPISNNECSSLNVFKNDYSYDDPMSRSMDKYDYTTYPYTKNIYPDR